MGEVWRARDTRLDRDVAIKVLPSEYAADAQLRQRFENEAKTIARLGHPNICTLYDVGEDYLVMELLDGEALDQRLTRGPMAVEEVLRYGEQIASALDRAHRAGIVHRDLKPGNVMLTKSGAKLLDFGLAKAARLPIRGSDPTRPRSLTETGMVVGTFHYMAPEQLEGREVDHRTDIFGLGATLYEMATARLAFAVDSRNAGPQPLSEVQPQVPPALEHVIEKCFARDPDERWQNAADIAEQLKWIGSQKAIRPARQRSFREPVWIVALLAAIAIAVWLAMKPQPRAATITASIAPEGNSGPRLAWGPPQFSPDGKWLIYPARDDKRQQLWLRSMERGTTQALAGIDNATAPFWSPDGSFIGFRGDGSLKKYSVSSGSVETITSMKDGGGAGWSCNRDGVILSFSVDATNAIYRIAVTGGPRKEILSAASIRVMLVAYPTFLPDGNHFLFTAIDEYGRRERTGLWIAALDRSEPPRFLVPATSHGVYVEPETLLYAREGILRARRFDPKRLRVSGEEELIAPVRSFEGAVWPFALFGASNSGMVAWQPPPDSGTGLYELLLKNRKGETLRKCAPAALYAAPRLSPDGRRVAVDRSDEKTSSGDIWTFNVDDGTASRISFDALNETTPQWSPQGDEVVWTLSAGPSGSRILRQRAGEGPREVLRSPGFVTLSDWSPDGRYLATEQPTKVWSFADRKWTEVGKASHGVFSPDSKWIAYESAESGHPEIFVQPFPPTGARYQVSPDGGSWPRWRREGEITYVDLSRRLQAVPVATSPAFRAGPPQPLFVIERSAYPAGVLYDVTPEGNVLVSEPVPETTSPPMKLLVNWRRHVD